MQFDRAEPLNPASPLVCAGCCRVLSGAYYTVQGRSLCAACGAALKRVAEAPFDPARFLKASVFGIAAVAVGGGVNALVASRWDLYVGWLSILAAVLVGFAVRLGSGNRGGRPYQVLAVALAYLAMAAMFIPIQHREGALTFTRVIQPLWVLLAAPFISGVQGLLLWSILGFSLAQAWRLNRAAPLDLQGPFVLRSTTPPDGSTGV
ncbi:MAG TPA: hypothetical protein VM222_03255 [Planctomycetota bacterium]|nr:hypothetical protein [Planctomycetota bacterium]